MSDQGVIYLFMRTSTLEVAYAMILIILYGFWMRFGKVFISDSFRSPTGPWWVAAIDSEGHFPLASCRPLVPTNDLCFPLLIDHLSGSLTSNRRIAKGCVVHLNMTLDFTSRTIY